MQPVVAGMCRDLTGIVRATTGKKHYVWVFDTLYPKYFPVFAQAMEVRMCCTYWSVDLPVPTCEGRPALAHMGTSSGLIP